MRIWNPAMLLTLLLTVSATGHSTCLGQATGIDAQAVRKAVESEMSSQSLVGVAIGIIRNGRVVFTHGYGAADIESGTPVTDETIFNWASNSKPFIAIAAMQLAQEGKLDLDASIHRYLPGLPAHLQPITTRHLLCHQSGIPHYSNGKIIRSGESKPEKVELDPSQCLHRFIESPLIFEPGSKTGYSSHAYILLSAVVQAASETSLGEQLASKIKNPLQMNSLQLDVAKTNQLHWATAYQIRAGQPRQVRDFAHFWKHGAGGYKSNVKDFARFASALMNEELIDHNTTQIMWTRQKHKNGQLSNYGLGVLVSGSGRGLKISHNGSQDETRTRMVIYPRQKHGIVVMCNTQGCNPGKISTAVYTALTR